ncbi:hypothetical protein [Elizabethkingia anophelis]|uniref:hypothetical protein n=1 Tax=Elizabethkingia anophelis TaxID=1117645 RepID=UPI0021A676CF|nr:hypothetical protein [Elizabethkingia anophelis]MCT3904397.1 hypothetical protein [Elizabethkingia anophelis]CAH1148072.1 hypothetical protein EAVVTKC53_02483 [Elizabethkingia anophelis]CAI9682823.1 hypothetical protein EAVVTKC53_02147 [Elizabethkingia anophelis]HDP3253853.1 hypothetical protein [Elizabethkingia anophelis]
MENQDKKITDYLIEKRLPLDILLEVKDHMEDQIAALETEQNLTFDDAFEQTKISWEKDLKMGFSLFSYKFRKITRLQNSIMMRNQLKIQKKAVLIMLAIFFTTVFSAFYLPQVAKYIFLAIYSSAALSGIVVLISGRKLLKTTKASYKKEISVFQRLASNYMFTGVLFIVLSNIVDVDECIGKVMKSTNEIFIHGNFSITEILHLAVGYLYVYSVVYGYFCYTDYKKAVEKIKERMTLEF